MSEHKRDRLDYVVALALTIIAAILISWWWR